MSSVMHLVRRHSRAVALWTLVASMAAAGALVLAVLSGTPPRSEPQIPLWALAIAFAATERCIVHLHFRRSAHALTLGELPLVLGLVFDAPVTVAMAWTLALLVVLVPTRPIPVRLAYNIANVWLATAIVGASLDLLADGGQATLWAGAALGAVAASVVSGLTLTLAMSLSGERMSPERIRAIMGMGVLVSVTNASVALAAAAVLEADPWAALFLIAPVGAIFGAYRAYTRQRTQHLNLEFLYEANRTLSNAEDRAAGLAGVLALATETFRAEIAEVCMLPSSEDEGASRVTLGPEERVEIHEPVAPEIAAELRELVGRDGARVVGVQSIGGALGARLRAMGVRDALIAGLRGDRRLVGTIMMANRLGGGEFGREDQRLFETLAGHTGTTISQDRLQRRVVELGETKDQLYHQAFHDSLTGLANRLLFDDRVAHALARRTGNAVVIYIDLDDFKPVNDTYGHEAGDALLCAVADRLRASLRPSDTPARLGGDEFAVLLVDLAPKDVRTVADRILRNVGAPAGIGPTAVPISASMGIAIAGSGSMAAEELLRKADAAMYIAKRGGKRRYTLSEPEPAAVRADGAEPSAARQLPLLSTK